MGFFGPSKQEKEMQERLKYEESVRKLMIKLEEFYCLDISKKDENAMMAIAENIKRTNMLNEAAYLQNLAENNSVENLKLEYLATLIEQNWLIIKKLTDISKCISNK